MAHKLVLDSVKDLDAVPFRTKPTEVKVAKMAYDFEIGDVAVSGSAGQYVVIDGKQVSVISESEFRARYTRVLTRKAAAAATSA